MQVVTILARFPATFQTSCASLDAKLRFLTQEMSRSLDELVSYPAFISLSLNKRVSHLQNASEADSWVRIFVNGESLAASLPEIRG